MVLLFHTPTIILTHSNGIIKYKNKINTVNNCYQKISLLILFFFKEKVRFMGFGVFLKENHHLREEKGNE